MPKLGECVVCSLQQQPRIGQVTKLRPGEKNPIALRLWRPSSKAASWIVAKYKPDKDVDNEECYTWISPVMIRYRNIKFDTDGFLTAESRAKMRKAMKGKRVKAPPSPSPDKAKTPAAPSAPPSRPARRRTEDPKTTPPVRPKPISNRKPNSRYFLRGTAKAKAHHQTTPGKRPSLAAAWGPTPTARYNLRRR